jgi:hypothetical protein
MKDGDERASSCGMFLWSLVDREHLPVQLSADRTRPTVVRDEPADLGDADLAVEDLAALVVGADRFLRVSERNTPVSRPGATLHAPLTSQAR